MMKSVKYKLIPSEELNRRYYFACSNEYFIKILNLQENFDIFRIMKWYIKDEISQRTLT